jgi:hypothetical protein
MGLIFFQVRHGANIFVGLLHVSIALIGSFLFCYLNLERRMGFWGAVFSQDVWTAFVFHLNTWLRRGGGRDDIIVARTARVYAAIKAAKARIITSLRARRSRALASVAPL